MSGIDIANQREITAVWSWEISSQELNLGDRFTFFFDCKTEQLPSDFKNGTSFFSIPELSGLKQALHHYLDQEEPLLFTHQTRHQAAGGTEQLTLEWRGEITKRDENANPLLMSGYTQAASSESKEMSTSNHALLYQKLMENLPDSIFFKDRESRFLSINNACAEKFGLSNPKEAIGKTDFDFFDKAHAQQAFNDEQEVMETKVPIINKIEKEGTPDNENQERWASTTKLPLCDEAGNVIGTFGITRDITSEEKAKTELKHNTEVIEKLSKQVPGFFYMYHHISDSKACFPFASHGIRDVYELTPEDVKDSIELILERTHPEDLDRFINSIRESALTLKTWECDYRVNLPKKGLRWLRGKAKPEQQPDGTVMGYGYITDITEKKEIYSTNVRLKRQFQAIFDSVPNLIFVKDTDGRYLMANNAMAHYFGKQPKEIVGKLDVDFGISEERAKAFIDADNKVIENNKPLFIPEDRTTKPDGSFAWHQTLKVPFQQTDSNKPAVLSIVTDVTQRKQKEIELTNSLDIIGQQNKRLSNFAHIVSHNLRNHAGSIAMLLELFSEEESKQEKEEYLKHLNFASKRLNETITDLNEIIDEQYNTSQNRKEVNLGEYISKIQQILTTDIIKHNVHFENRVPDDLCFKYVPAYLESIILNLLSNAIKYRHPDREPIIKIEAHEQDDKVHFSVSDNGLGIDLNKHGDKLFGMYKTFHSNENSKGIGLFITKNQVETLGGSIKVESEPGKGTTFKIRF